MRTAIQERPQDPRHGTFNGYSNLGCRCERCRVAGRVYQRGRRKPCASGCGALVYPNRTHCRPCKAALRTFPLEKIHGTELGYKRGCRCEPCRVASASARRMRRAANPDVRQRENEKRMERYYAGRQAA